jgi:hypothetical protein
MTVDLVQRVYNEKSKGNLGPIKEFDQWLETALAQGRDKIHCWGTSFHLEDNFGREV